MYMCGSLFIGLCLRVGVCQCKYTILLVTSSSCCRLQLLSAILDKYPSTIPEEEYTQLLPILHQLQAETKKVRTAKERM